MEFTCQHVHKTYQARDAVVSALEDVTFRVNRREFIAIVGPSGCGKTTLLKLVAGLLEPTSGYITFGTEYHGARPATALVFQEHGLFPWLSVLDNVAFGLEMQGVRQAARHERARSFIDKVGLGSFAGSYPHELSIGMRQRVGIARAFVAGAPILLMDEPFGSLDAQTKRVLQEELLQLWRNRQKTVVYVTHDIEEAVLMADRVLVMTGRPGHVREEVTISLSRPRDLSLEQHPEVVDIKWHIWKMLEDEVRRSLQPPN